MRKNAAAAAAVLAGLLAGCGTGSGHHADAEAPLTTPSAEQQITLPLESYYPTPEQDALLNQARAQLILQCMQSFGLTFSTTAQQSTGTDPYRTDRFLLSDATLAARYGYHSAPEVYARQAQENTDAAKDGWKPTPAEKTVFDGVGQNTYDGKKIPPGGCRQQAFGSLSTVAAAAAARPPADSGDAPPDIYFVQSLRHKAADKAAQDSRVVGMEQAWSSCMHAAGYTYTSPEQAARDPRWQVGTTPQKGEIPVAKADVACKTKVNYLGIMTQVTTETQKSLVEDNAEALSTYKKDFDQQLKRATAILSGASGNTAK